MKTIAVLDSKNYDANGPRTLRKAVRAVIRKNEKYTFLKREAFILEML